MAALPVFTTGNNGLKSLLRGLVEAKQGSASRRLLRGLWLQGISGPPSS
jgi:hypothetical protein